MRLYSYWRSSASWRVRTVLALKGIEYEYVAVDIGPGAEAQDTAEYKELNALRQVPVLEWSEDGRTVRLTQSVAIAEYLDALVPVPPLLPSDPLNRARVREVVEIVASGVQPLQNNRVLKRVRELGGEGAVSAWAQDAIARGLAALEAHAALNAGMFCVGDAPTLADVFLVPQVYNANRFGVDVSAFPKIVELATRASALPAFVAAHPDRQLDTPNRITPAPNPAKA